MRSLISAAALGVAAGCGSASTDPVGPELAYIQKPSEPRLGILLVNDDGVYHFWIEGSGPVYGGTVSKEQLVNLVRSTSDAVQDQLWACASSDYGKCSASDD